MLPEAISGRRREREVAVLFLLGFTILAVVGLTRWSRDPSFWLDEAYIAMNLKQGSPGHLLGPLQFGQWFPRLYLMAIGFLAGFLGASTRVLRLLPLSCFLVASGFACLILYRLAGRSRLLALLALGLLISPDVWLLQAASLKQYSFDVLLGLIPFVLPDRFFTRLLGERGGWLARLLVTLPLALSYTYSIPLAGRILGHLLENRRIGGPDRRRILPRPLLLMAVCCVFWMGLLYVTDLRFNSRSTVAGFWSECVLRDHWSHPQAMLMPLLRLFFAWYRHTVPAVFSVVLGFFLVLGAGQVAGRWLGPGWGVSLADRPWWSTVASGSLMTLLGLVGASLLAGYPLCRGRLTLFVMIHIQILILTGAARLRRVSRFKRTARGGLILLMVGFVPFALQAANRMRLQPARENLRPLLAALDVDRSATLFIHDCSLTQWRTLPETPPLAGLPLDGSPEENLQRLRSAQAPVWILWTHLLGPCGERFQVLRQAATSWQVIYQGPGAGLALADYGPRPVSRTVWPQAAAGAADKKHDRRPGPDRARPEPKAAGPPAP